MTKYSKPLGLTWGNIQSLWGYGWLEKKYDNTNHWNIIACQNLYWYINGTTNGRNEAQENFKATSAEKNFQSTQC